MPNVKIGQSGRDWLAVQWGDRDPTVTLTHWKSWEDPGGKIGGNNPVSNWALDRTAINKLIRTLRRARDNTFGADA